MGQLMKNISELGMISIFNIVIIIILLLPGIVFMFRTKHFRKHTSNKVMMILEHAGRLACVLLMIFPFTKKEFGFSSVEYLLAYMFVNGFALVLYVALCVSYVKKPKAVTSAVLAVIPVAVFIVCGVTLEHYLLIFSAVLYGIGHIYRTIADSKNRYSEAKQLEKEREAAQAEEAEKAAQEAAAQQTLPEGTPAPQPEQ